MDLGLKGRSALTTGATSYVTGTSVNLDGGMSGVL